MKKFIVLVMGCLVFGYSSINAMQLSSNDTYRKSNKYGDTLLHWAVRNGYSQIVSILLEDSNVNIDARNKQGLTPLHLALLYGKKNITAQLVINGASTVTVRVDDPDGAIFRHLIHLVPHYNIFTYRGNFFLEINPTKSSTVNHAIKKRNALNELLVEGRLRSAKLALVMGLHPRTGANSPLRILDIEVIKNIAKRFEFGDYVHRSMVVAPC